MSETGAKLCIFAGTSEGRLLAERLAGRGAELTVCVATEYAKTLLEGLEGAVVRAGRMPQPEIEKMLESGGFDAVADATHPYAQSISESLKRACEAAGTEYIRLLRPETSGSEDGIFVKDTRECVDFLKSTEGNILLTTGSKTLAEYCADEGLRGRIYARVLPAPESLEICTACGLPADRVIALQGPFSRELNEAMMRHCGAGWLVTKDSGRAGGYEDKILAARSCGAAAVIIGRPCEERGLGFEECAALLEEKLGLSPLQRRRKVYLVGTGMGGRDTLTFGVARAVERSSCIIGAQRMLEDLGSEVKSGKKLHKAVAARDIADIIEKEASEETAVLFSGDTGFYSGAASLLGVLEERGLDCEAELLPGIGSLSYFCARLGRPWQDVKALSLHGREADIASCAAQNPAVFTLLGGENGAAAALRRLCEAGLGDLTAHIGQRLGYEDESVVSGRAEELAIGSYDALSVLLVENPGWRKFSLVHGLADESFERTDVPMTKQEVRSICISKLAPGQGSTIWDVGSGSGSVTAECAIQAPFGTVCAVEKDAEAAALTRRNCERFGLMNVLVKEGEAPEALSDLPAPDCVFIGGSGGDIKAIAEAALKKNPGVRIVASAVTMETAAELTELCKAFETSEICCVNVSRDRKLGRYRLMTAQNPVYIFTMQSSTDGTDTGGGRWN